MIELPGVKEDGMSGRNEQRKLGTARGSPRRTRTAKASRISRHAVKSRCAREWGGWGRLSDDGPGQNNPDPSEGPWMSGGRETRRGACQPMALPLPFARETSAHLPGSSVLQEAVANYLNGGDWRIV